MENVSLWFTLVTFIRRVETHTHYKQKHRSFSSRY